MKVIVWLGSNMIEMKLLMLLLLVLCMVEVRHAFQPYFSKHHLVQSTSSPLQLLPSRLSNQQPSITKPQPWIPSHQSAHSLTKQSTRLSSLIAASDAYSLWAFVSFSAMAGLWLEKRTQIGKALSGAVCAMLISVLLTNIHILPSTGSVHITSLQSFVVKLATPMLLLSADLSQLLQQSRAMIAAFSIGTCGTFIGSIVSFFICKSSFQQTLSPVLWQDLYQLLGAICAKNIGGGLNFMAVVDTLQTSPTLVSLGLAVDNIVGLVYFPIVSCLGSWYNQQLQQQLQPVPNDATATTSLATTTAADSNTISSTTQLEINPTRPSFEVEDVVGSLTLSLGIVALSECLSRLFQWPALVVSTIVSTLLATFAQKYIASFLPISELLGKVLLLLFVSSVGVSSGDILEALRSPAIMPLLAFTSLVYLVHFLFMFVFGYKAFKLPIPDLLLGSNANIGNAATASALASSMKWKDRLIPAIVLGNVGNCIGTLIGLFVAVKVIKPFT